MTSIFTSKKLSLYVVLALALTVPALAASQPNGVHNFHQVNEHIYRGAQPSDDGFRSLATLGVKTVLDLRESGGRADAEKRMVEAAGMHYVNIPMRGLEAPSDEAIEQALALLDNETAGPVFVHCRRGADRTGTVIACYRIEHDRWDNQAAFKEAKSDGMAWIQFAMAHYIQRYHAPLNRAAAPSAVAAAGASQ